MKKYNTVEQGNFGVTHAIAYFTSVGYAVNIPLNDSRYYDLVIEKNAKFYSVQVKTTSRMPYKNFVATIKSVRPNRTGNKIINFDNTKVDFLYVLTSNNESYCIPAEKVDTKVELTLGDRFDKYKVEILWRVPPRGKSGLNPVAG